MFGDASDRPQTSARVRCLAFHADYGCQNTGVCCASGWEIPIEERVELAIRGRAHAATRLPNGPDGFKTAHDASPGCKSSLRRHEPSSSCWFRDPAESRCAIHREFGEDSLPSACRHFPRICVLEPNGVSLSLSHYCPTAAAMLFENSGDFTMVEDPRGFPRSWPYEGLDATTACSPFLRPGVLLGFDGLRAFEESALTSLSVGDVWASLSRIDSLVEGVRAWTPTGPAPPDLIRGLTEVTGSSSAFRLPAKDPRPALRRSLTPGTPVAVPLPDHTCGRPHVPDNVDLALRRYLAGRLIAAWVTYQADDLRAVAKYLHLCLDTVLLFQAAQGSDGKEERGWKEAIRSADLWILHYCDPELLALNLR